MGFIIVCSPSVVRYNDGDQLYETPPAGDNTAVSCGQKVIDDGVRLAKFPG
jgi:hypothetical protein